MERSVLNLPLAPQTLAKPREGVFAGHLTLYIGIVLIAALASYGAWLHFRWICACQASAYCGGRNYADYEHGAFAFNLEPPALENASNADVLVLGNSKLQIALSNEATDDWFKAAKARNYLMGFSYSENIVFNELLLQKMRPPANVFVINVRRFLFSLGNDGGAVDPPRFGRREPVRMEALLAESPPTLLRYVSRALRKTICCVPLARHRGVLQDS
jgi:hypothetical protein